MSSNLLLNGRYRLVDRIAAGGMGEVWSASDEVLGREVAVKLLKNQYVADDQFRARFRAEAQYSARLSHPGIAQVYDFGEQDDLAFLVMELVRGEPLSAILERAGRLTPEVTLDLMSQAARALQTAHDAGIVHRDIKPGNLMITSDGRVKITDFGIARASQSNTLTQTGMVMGTAQYVSPEQASGKTVTAASDIYSLGVVAYECLAGAPPFSAEQPIAIALAHVRDMPPELPEDVPQPVADLVMHTLAKDPNARPMPATRLSDAALAMLETLDGGYAPTNGFASPRQTTTGQTMMAGAPGVPPGMPPGDGRTSMQPPIGPTGELDEQPPPRSRKRLIAVASLAVAVIAIGAVLTATMWPGSNQARYSGDNPGSRTTATGNPNGPAATDGPHVPRTPLDRHTNTLDPQQPTSEPTHTHVPRPTHTHAPQPTHTHAPQPTHTHTSSPPTHTTTPPSDPTTPPSTSP